MPGPNDLPGLDQWQAPVFTVMHRVPTFLGVPMEFFVVTVLGTFFVTMWLFVAGSVLCLSALTVGILLYVVAIIGTKIEPRWLPMLCEYLSYGKGYEA